MQKRFSTLSQKEIEQLPVMDMITYLDHLLDQIEELPLSLETKEDYISLQHIMSKCDSLFAYFDAMAQKFKSIKKAYKTDGEDKLRIQDAMEREDTFAKYAEIVKFRYSAASRLVTIKQQFIDILKMTGDIPVK